MPAKKQEFKGELRICVQVLVAKTLFIVGVKDTGDDYYVPLENPVAKKALKKYLKEELGKFPKTAVTVYSREDEGIGDPMLLLLQRMP